MDKQRFENWFRELKDIWETKTPERIVDICADKFFWYETQFEEPLRTKEALLAEWHGILTQDDIRVACELLFTDGQMGLAHWHATFINASDEEVELDGIFQITLDKDGKCIEFHQWRDKK